jgi:hypothetical protein
VRYLTSLGWDRAVSTIVLSKGLLVNDDDDTSADTTMMKNNRRTSLSFAKFYDACLKQALILGSSLPRMYDNTNNNSQSSSKDGSLLFPPLGSLNSKDEKMTFLKEKGTWLLHQCLARFGVPLTPNGGFHSMGAKEQVFALSAHIFIFIAYLLISLSLLLSSFP